LARAVRKINKRFSDGGKGLKKKKPRWGRHGACALCVVLEEKLLQVDHCNFRKTPDYAAFRRTREKWWVVGGRGTERGVTSRSLGVGELNKEDRSERPRVLGNVCLKRKRTGLDLSWRSRPERRRLSGGEGAGGKKEGMKNKGKRRNGGGGGDRGYAAPSSTPYDGVKTSLGKNGRNIGSIVTEGFDRR